MTGEQFIDILDLFLTIINTCAIVWMAIFIFQDEEEDEEEEND